MKTINRDHGFENKLNLVKMGRKYFYIYHEKNEYPVKAEITPDGGKAFFADNWNYFEWLESQNI